MFVIVGFGLFGLWFVGFTVILVGFICFVYLV